MKRFIALLSAISIMTASVAASEITVVLDGAEVEFSSQEPVIVEGRTLIPLRGVFEQLGYEISWDAVTKTAVFSNADNTIYVTAESEAFIMNGEEIPLDVPAGIINGSMMLPLRAVGEAAGLEVGWDSETKTVSLSSAEQLAEEMPNSSSDERDSVIYTDNISYEDAEALQNAAEDLSKIYEASCLNFAYGLCNINIINNAENFSKSDFESIINKMPELTAIYENVFEKIDFPDSFGSAENDFLTYLRSFEDLYTSLYNLILASLSASEEYGAAAGDLADIMTKFGEAGTVMEDVEEKSETYANTMLALVKNISNDDGIAEYTNSENLTEEEKAAKEEYFSEINSFINSELSKLTFSSETYLEDCGYMSKSELDSAAEILRNKLNTTETPKNCMLSKYILLKACDLLSEAGELYEDSEFNVDYTNELYVDYFSKYTAAGIFLSTFYYENYNRGLTLQDFPYDEAGTDDLGLL